MENQLKQTFNFNDVMKEAKELEKKQRKEYKKVSKNDIVKQRLVQLYSSGIYTNKDIAHILCISKQNLDRLLRTPEVIEQLKTYQEEEKQLVDSKLKALRSKAMDTMMDLLESEEDTVRLNASKDILDRTGHKAKEAKDVNVNVTYEQRIMELTQTVDTSFIDCDEYQLIEVSDNE